MTTWKKWKPSVSPRNIVIQLQSPKGGSVPGDRLQSTIKELIALDLLLVVMLQ